MVADSVMVRISFRGRVGHDGEAAEQRAAFAALDEDRQKDLHVFLLSLTRQPKLKVER